MLIPICRDHFKRLVKNDVCSSCPSRIENEQIVEKLSELYRDDEQGTLKAIFIEIQSLRRLTSTQQEKIEQIEKLANEINIVLFGINRTNGINGEVKSVKQKPLIEIKVKEDNKKVVVEEPKKKEKKLSDKEIVLGYINEEIKKISENNKLTKEEKKDLIKNILKRGL